MKARIDFEVENEEEFEKLKECSKLPNEKWSLLSKKEDIELNKLIEMKTCYVNENEVIIMDLPKDKDGIEINSNDIYFPIIHKEDVEKLLDKTKQETDEKVKELKERILNLSILEINKDLNVSEVVEKSLEEINKIFWDKK